ncbi:unnamed protein product [Rotaria magnacalcarata]|nr:unnamed protein product [Rotaria magnacalcarata]CAF1480459.1 unnamed protein product [Rotaria magnacalcarata]CAF3896331.1 unnamed protein product [Rotaria magnacalcarata]CAF4567083.1 unnamed protein product [Rotaria magnacalcarata]CAF4797866.1 unnamed protein product [Rotaria magnacalcarata]
MRKRRLNRRENKTSQASQDDQNEQCCMDISNLIDQATIDILVDSTTALTDYMDSASCRSESSDEFESNVDDNTNDDFDDEAPRRMNPSLGFDEFRSVPIGIRRSSSEGARKLSDYRRIPGSGIDIGS